MLRGLGYVKADRGNDKWNRDMRCKVNNTMDYTRVATKTENTLTTNGRKKKRIGGGHVMLQTRYGWTVGTHAWKWREEKE